MLASPVAVFAEYAPEELCVIEWGDKPHQLKIDMPVWVDLNNTPDDPSDDLIEEDGGGPTQVFVDRYENVYISSNELNYLKAFNSKGRLILNCSEGEPVYEKLFSGYTISKFYVDSLSRIYILSRPTRRYITVMDILGNLLGRINPLGLKSDFGVWRMYRNSKDVLTIYTGNMEAYTLENNAFTPGGAMSWKALDGYYYNAGREDSTRIRFIRYSNPDIEGRATDLIETFVPYNPYFFSVSILGVDDRMRIYVSMLDSESNSRIQIYSTAYELLDEIVFPPASNKYWRSTGSHLRNDGTIYELRYMDDGLHIFRWSEQ